MQVFLDLLLASGKKGFELAFYLLMPIMVFMMAFMRVLDKKGVLRMVAIVAAPVMLVFGLPGLGVFAVLQILLVSFAAPVSTFRIMDQDAAISDRKIAAALAGILCMSQANAAFALTVVGLNLPVTMLSSLFGCLVASLLTYRFFARHLPDHDERNARDEIAKEEDGQSLVQTIMTGAEEGFQLVLKSLPLLVLAVLMVNVLNKAGAIAIIERVMSPALSLVGVSGSAVLAIVTKYIAGGTAMMGAVMDLITEKKVMTALELNRIAGFILNPLDPVGLAVLTSSGKRVAAFAVPAIKGALAGILVRGIFHLLVF